MTQGPQPRLYPARRADAGARVCARLLAAIKGLAPPRLPEAEGHGDVPQGEPFVLTLGRDRVIGPLVLALLVEAHRPQPTLFPNGNRGMPLALLTWARVARRARGPRLAGHLELVRRQLADGRAFLQGAAPGLADAACALVVGAAISTAAGARLVAGAPPLQAWWERITALGGDASGRLAWPRRVEPLLAGEPLVVAVPGPGGWTTWKPRPG